MEKFQRLKISVNMPCPARHRASTVTRHWAMFILISAVYEKKQKILSGHSIYQPPYIPQKSRRQTLAFPMKLRLLPTSTQTALLPILRVLIRMGFLWLPPYSVALFMRQPPTQTTRC